MQEAALEVESNLLASSKLKDKSNLKYIIKKGKKEMMSSTSTWKSSKNKLDETTKLIKNMSAKINRLEKENKNQTRPIQEGERNPNQFRHHFVPRFLLRERINNDIQRERRDNEDQIIQPHFQNNLIGDDESYEVDEREVEDLDEHEHVIDQIDDGFSSVISPLDTP